MLKLQWFTERHWLEPSLSQGFILNQPSKSKPPKSKTSINITVLKSNKEIINVKYWKTFSWNRHD